MEEIEKLFLSLAEGDLQKRLITVNRRYLTLKKTKEMVM